jgi:DNA-binding response OmpR family regulator
MRKFDKNRTRLLIICADKMITNKLVTLFTSYGYFVDYVTTRKEGVVKFRQYKQGIIIIDADLIPRYPKHFFHLFSTDLNNPKILIAVKPYQQIQFNQYLNNGIYDIIQVPLNFENLNFILRRLIAHDTLSARYEFLYLLVKLSIVSLPIWIYFMVVIMMKTFQP